MEQNFQQTNSPVAHSERKDSTSYPVFTLPKRLENNEELPPLNLDFCNEENGEETHSIFNIGYSPQPRPLDFKGKHPPRDLKLAFPGLVSMSRNDSIFSKETFSGNHLTSLCQLFEINLQKYPLQKEEESFEEISRVDESRCSLFPKTFKNSVLIKEYLSELMKHSEEETQNFREFENNIKSKGLKLLSIIVFDIVNDKVTTSYKEVADLILKDTILNYGPKTDKKNELSREEQNIKRRVYDVLNVLISASTFLKEGKIVKKNNLDSKIIIKNKRAELNSMYSKLVSLEEGQEDTHSGKGTHGRKSDKEN